MASLALNPGGHQRGGREISVEGGNAYRVERWRGRTGPNTLQKQIISLYTRIAERSGWDAVKLMDRSLAANLCPFRSASWKKLPNKAGSLKFATTLWHDIANALSPRVIVTISPDAAKAMAESLRTLGYRVRDRQELPAYWGSVTCERLRLERGADQVLIVRFPHLSRFTIIDRKESAPTVDQLVKDIADAL